jgi:hypothetical protein
MKSIGPLYVDLVTYPVKRFNFIIEKGWSQEIEEPYRHGSCIVLKAPFIKTGIAVGIWRYKNTENQALMAAIKARTLDIPVEELMEW